jgi:DNA-binding SARP family transcriptional activator
MAFLLWPDSTEAQARTNLRHLLHNLRRASPELSRHIDVTPQTLRWRPLSPSSVDVARFTAALARSD